MQKVKWEDFKKACEHLESVPTLYFNSFPLNCLDAVKEGGYVYKTADCWNYIKALLWSNCAIAYDNTVGNHCYAPNSELGDWDGANILAHCYDRSTDMSNIREGEFMYLVYQGGSHAGVYMGNGKVCEFTPIWENGCHFSDVAKDGTRSYMGVRYAKWQEHGMMPWIEYPKDEEDPIIVPPTEDITEIEVDGDSDTHLTVWQKLWIDIIFAIAKAINKTFKE